VRCDGSDQSIEVELERRELGLVRRLVGVQLEQQVRVVGIEVELEQQVRVVGIEVEPGQQVRVVGIEVELEQLGREPRKFVAQVRQGQVAHTADIEVVEQQLVEVLEQIDTVVALGPEEPVRVAHTVEQQPVEVLEALRADIEAEQVLEEPEEPHIEVVEQQLVVVEEPAHTATIEWALGARVEARLADIEPTHMSRRPKTQRTSPSSRRSSSTSILWSLPSHRTEQQAFVQQHQD